MNNYCQCKKPDMDTDDRGNQYCIRCLKPVEMPDYEPEYEPEITDEELKGGEI